MKIKTLNSLHGLILFCMGWLMVSCQQQPEFLGFTYPDGKYKSLIMSYDDGTLEDIQLVELFNQHNIVGTFNLNSEFLGTIKAWPLENGDTAFVKYVSRDSLLILYENHEIAAHGAFHKDFGSISGDEVLEEVNTDLAILSELTGRKIESLAYPFGNTNDSVISHISTTSITNARTVDDTHQYNLPTNFLKWAPTCHDSKALDHMDRYMQLEETELSVFYVWGHSWEFGDETRWKNMIKFCETIGGKDDIWYTGTGPLTDYLMALDLVQIQDGKIINPENNSRVWLNLSTGLKALEAGESLKVKKAI